MLSPNVDCGVIWLHTPGIHVRFFRAHTVIIFLGTDTLKAQKASPGDKFFGSLGALNITYSMFIQMGHAIRDVVIIIYKGDIRPWYLLRFFAPFVVLGHCGSSGASKCEIPQGGLDGLLSYSTPIRMALIDGRVEGIAIRAAVHVLVAMPIVDTNPHSSTVDEDGNEQVAVSMLSGMVSEDGQGCVGA